MAQSVQSPEHLRATAPTEPTPSRLCTVTANKFPRKCARGCGFPIPRDPGIRYVVNFGATKPYPVYLREHSPNCVTYRVNRARKTAEAVPGFRPGTALLREAAAAARSATQCRWLLTVTLLR